MADDRIDHVAEAVTLIRRVSGARMTDGEAIVSLMGAQVHATLALVEQQRIANLIALADVAGDPDIRVSPAEQQAWDALGVRGPGVLRPEIAAALGIEVGGDD